MSVPSVGTETHTPTRLYLARHGQTDYNVQRRFQGRIDIPLNATGELQAKALARAMQQIKPDVVFASPLGRAVATAQATADLFDLSVQTDERLVERSFGLWEGLSREDISSRYPEQWEAYGQRRPTEGMEIEERGAVSDRMAAACRDIVREHRGQTILVVSHGAAISLAITELLGFPREGRPPVAGMENCHRSLLEPLVTGAEPTRMRLLSHNVPPDFTAAATAV